MFFRDRIQDNSKYLVDRSNFKGKARYVILPNDETELREGMRYSSKGNTKVTISGNRTGSSGGAVPSGGDIMSMEYLRGVIGVGQDDNGVFIRAHACTPISMINDILSNSDPEHLTEGTIDDIKGLRFPVNVDPRSSIGGCIAANRSDIRSHVRRIKVVFSDSTFTTIERGDCVADGRNIMFSAGRNFYSFQLPSYTSDGKVGPKIEDNMDLIDLFIGSEGIFGVITEADIYVSSEVKDGDTQESGKLSNDVLKEKYGPKAIEDLVKVKSILDVNYILNLGNLI